MAIGNRSLELMWLPLLRVLVYGFFAWQQGAAVRFQNVTLEE